MSLLSKLATSIITFVAAVFLLPKFGSYTIGFALRTLGWSIQRRTADRRQAILDRVRVEREDFDSKRDKRTSKSSEDEEWEKVDDTAPGTPPKGKGTEDDWDGIVGFFHPFWYAYDDRRYPVRLLTLATATQVEEGNVYFGRPSMRRRNDGPRLLALSIPEITKLERLKWWNESRSVQYLDLTNALCLLLTVVPLEPLQHPTSPANARATVSVDA